MSMLGEKAVELLHQLRRSEATEGANAIPVFNDELVREVLEEMGDLFQCNQEEVRATSEGERGLLSGIQLRHAALERNQRCVLAYLYNRAGKVRQLRWEMGGAVPQELKRRLHEQEVQWFTKYSRSLAKYMSSLGGGSGLDLTRHMQPPTGLHLQVRCLVEYGEFETEDGTVVQLTKNSQHFLLKAHCEHLIRQGVLEHVV